VGRGILSAPGFQPAGRLFRNQRTEPSSNRPQLEKAAPPHAFGTDQTFRRTTLDIVPLKTLCFGSLLDRRSGLAETKPATVTVCHNTIHEI